MSFVLVGAWYRERELARWQELVTCLARNVANPHIAEVHLLLEEADVECPLLGHPKLRVFAHGRRATFRALFDHANRSLAGRSVIVANADIHFDDTLERVGAGDLDGALLCLSRWELGGLYEEPRSQDAWLFAAPLPDIACDFELGRPGCDNRLAWEAQRAGLRVANPARSVRAHHVHASAIRRYSERDRVPGETAEVPAITLGTLRRRRAGTPAAALAAVSFREAMGYRIARLAAGVSSHVDLERPFARIPERLAGCSFTQLVGAAMSPVAVELATSGSVYLLAERNGPASRRVRAWLRVTAEREPEADLQTTHDNGFEAWSVTGEPGDTLAVPGPVLLVAATLARAADLAPSVRVPRIDAIEAAPLVSCIMPTADRREHVVRALRYWSRQDWPERELVVVDDGALGVDDVMPDDPRVRYLRIERGRSLGEKRNIASRAARGSIIAHWDDDDWYPPWRLRAQVEALRDADVCGTSRELFWDPAVDRAWLYRRADVLLGASLAYRRAVWERAPFAHVNVGEDTRFLRTARGRRRDLGRPELCIGIVHARNASPKRTGDASYTPVAAATVHAHLGDDAHELRPCAGLVSCILPTRDRRGFIPLCVRWFVAQDWADRELVVVDDGADPIGDLLRDVPGVRYCRVNRPLSIGAKRNLACREARGAVIVHWDDDDWYGPDRLRRQVEPIFAGRADLTGLETGWTLELAASRFWTIDPALHRRMFVGDVHGGTLAFRRGILEAGIRYPDANIAEDARLLRAALARGFRLERIPNTGSFVYVRHATNAWRFPVGKHGHPRWWSASSPPAAFPASVLVDYRRAIGAP